MRDRLEDFINNNREDFDQKVPSLKVWSDIEKRLDPPKAKRFSIVRAVGIAASVVFLLGMGAIMGNYFTEDGVRETPMARIDKNDFPDYAQQEESLQIRINQKRAQLASFSYDNSVNEDLSDLDKTLNELKAELKNVPEGSQEQIIQAMIKNYETKVKILEIVLKRINSANPKRDKQNEGSEI